MGKKYLVYATDEQVALIEDFREYAGLGPTDLFRQGLVLLAQKHNFEHGVMTATKSGGTFKTRPEKIAAGDIKSSEPPL